jgi:hypothetical protein
MSRGSTGWGRLAPTLLAAALIAGGAALSVGTDVFSTGDSEPQATWAAVTFVALRIVFVFACAAPRRRISPYW